jgi:hypothetical protein
VGGHGGGECACEWRWGGGGSRNGAARFRVVMAASRGKGGRRMRCAWDLEGGADVPAYHGGSGSARGELGQRKL